MTPRTSLCSVLRQQAVFEGGGSSEFTCFMYFLWGIPKPGNCEPSPPRDKRMSSEFFQVPRSICRESPYFHISHVFLHISFIFLHISFIIPSYFFIYPSFIFLIFFIVPSYFFIFPSYSWDLEKFRASP